MPDIKETILKKLNKLEELINKNHESGDDLFPKHWLILLKVKNEVNISGTVGTDVLEMMNKIWKINKKIESAGSTIEFKKVVWQTIDEFLQDNDNPRAIRIFQNSFVKDDGKEYTLSEAKIQIERHTKKNNGKSS